MNLTKKNTTRLNVEALENRLVPTTTAMFNSGVLQIRCTDTDNVVVRSQQDGSLAVTNNGFPISVYRSEYAVYDKTVQPFSIYGQQTLFAVNVDCYVGGRTCNIDLTGIDANVAAKMSSKIWGTQDHDTLTGMVSGHNEIYGRGGDDVITGGAGSDTLNAGILDYQPSYASANDLWVGSNYGNPTIHGGAGDDVIKGEWGANTLYGDAGNDTLLGAVDVPNAYPTMQWTQKDIMYGGDGNDTLTAGSGAKYQAQSVNNPTGTPGDTLDGGNGTDTLNGGAYDDNLSGGTGNDTIHGNDGNDFLQGGAGNDLIYGDNGNDELHGGDNDDTLDGGAGNDQLYGEAGNDKLIGGTGWNFFDGGIGINPATKIGDHDFEAMVWAVAGSKLAVGGDDGCYVTQAASPQDISQSLKAGTCWINSALTATSRTTLLNQAIPHDAAGQPTGPGIAYSGNGNYQVALFRAGTNGAAGKWITQTVAFTGSTTATDPVLHDPKSTIASEKLQKDEYWMVVYQRAILQEAGINWHDDNAVAEAGKTSDTALAMLTGQPVTTHEFDKPTWTPDQLQWAVYSGSAVVADTGAQINNPFLARPNHCYDVVDVYSDGAKWYVTLRNPWGKDQAPADMGANYKAWGANDGYIHITWDSFVKNFARYRVAGEM